MKPTCHCTCSPNCNQDLIVITIQSGCKNKKSKHRQSVEENSDNAETPKSKDTESLEPTKPSETSVPEAKKSKKSIAVESNQLAKPQSQHKIYKLPIVCDRHHGPGCAMEICVLEKHDDACIFKKEDNEGRNLADDRVGSYDCIGRLIFKTCNEDNDKTLVNKSRSKDNLDEFDPEKQIYGGVVANKNSQNSPERKSIDSRPSKLSSTRQMHNYSQDTVDEETIRPKSASRTYQAPYREMLRRRQELTNLPRRSYGDNFLGNSFEENYAIEPRRRFVEKEEVSVTSSRKIAQMDESIQTPLYFSYTQSLDEEQVSSYENLTAKKRYGSGLIAGLFGGKRKTKTRTKSKH